jgi:hypothetical protein
LCTFAHETAGAARTRHSLLPLLSRDKRKAKLGQDLPRERERLPASPSRKSETTAAHMLRRRIERPHQRSSMPPLKAGTSRKIAFVPDLEWL